MKQLQEAVISVWPLFFGLGFLMLGNGLQGTLLSVRANGEGFAVLTTGFVMTMYYVGFLAGSIYAPRLVENVGHIRVFAALASLASATVLLHAVFVHPVVWAPVRAISGFSFAGLFVIIESWLNDRATNESRGKILSVYFVIMFAGLSLGQGLLNIASPMGMELFILTSVLVSFALVPISLSRRPAPDFHTPETISLRRLYIISPLALVGVFINGLTIACLFTLTPVVADDQGLKLSEISFLMIAFIAGGVLLQTPLGWLSDRIDRRKVIIGVSILSCLAGVLCAFTAGMEARWAYFASMSVFGGLSLSVYGLSISHANDHLDKRFMVAASSSLLLVNACGACFGPVGMGLLLQIIGPDGFFPLVAFFYALLAGFGIYRAFIRPPVPTEDQGDYVTLAPRSSTVVYQIAEEDRDQEDDKR